jgi:hypothetical protein
MTRQNRETLPLRRNSKSGARNSKQIRNPKQLLAACRFRISDFEFVSDFDIRDSDLRITAICPGPASNLLLKTRLLHGARMPPRQASSPPKSTRNYEEKIMKNLLALGAAALLGFAGIGWYLGWYTFESTPTATGKHISIDLNTGKIKQDVGTGKEKLRDYLSGDDKNPSVSNSPAPTQTGNPVTPTGYQTQGGNDFPYPTSSNSNPPIVPVPPSGTAPRLPTPR